MSIFGIQYTDVQNKIAPNMVGNTFRIGNATGDSLSTAECDKIINAQEHRALSLLPRKFADLLSGYVKGEVLAISSGDGNVYQLSLFPVVDATTKIYINYPQNKEWRYRDGNNRLIEDAYTVHLASGYLTFDPDNIPAVGSCIIAEYQHSAAPTFVWFREVVIALSALEISRRFAYFRSAEGIERFADWESSALASLKDVEKTHRTGIRAIDDIQLMEDLRPDSFRFLFRERNYGV